MRTYTFASGRRVREAKFGARMGKTGYTVGRFVLLGLLLGSALLAFSGSKLAYPALGLALLDLMLVIWYHWELADLPGGKVDLSAQHVALDTILDRDTLAMVHWPITRAELWERTSSSWGGKFVLGRLQLPAAEVAGLVTQAPADDAVWEVAYELAAKHGDEVIDSAAIVCALIMTSDTAAYLQSRKLSAADIEQIYAWIVRLKHSSRKDKNHFGGIARDWASGYTPILSRMGHNLSTEVERGGQSFRSLAHHPLIDQMATNLSRPGVNNIVLVGQPGSGKTSLVYALAERMLRGQVGRELSYQQVVSLNAAMLATSKPGELEQLMLQSLGEAVHAGNIVLFLDEAQLFFGSGTGAVNLGQLLLPVLQHPGLRLIMAMSPGDWQRLTAAYPSLPTMFNLINVGEPSENEVMEILEDRAIILDYQTKSLITYQALKEAYRLSGRYLQDQAYPGRALKLLADSVSGGGLVTAQSVQAAIERTTGIKTGAATADEGQKLLNLEDAIHERMINQTRAVSVVAAALRRSRAGVANPNRPVGSFLFLGPTGVGKTELAKALAAVYFGGSDQMVRVDMSEFQQPADVARLLAAPADQGGSNWLTAVRERPFGVVLLDEIEKAHPDILNLLLQVLDEGSITDSQGRKVSFKETIVICTSNAGADEIRERIGRGEELESFETQLTDALIGSHQFRPELLNRFDEIVVFRPLKPTELLQVVGLMVGELNQNLANQKIAVALTPEAMQLIVDRGYDPRLGARPMRRMLQRLVEDTVAKKILGGSAQAGDTISLDATDLSGEPMPTQTDLPVPPQPIPPA